jgi:glucuronosyltransferase
MHKAETDGVGKKLFFNELSVDRIRDSILEVITNDSYRVQMNEKSKLFRDQPELPLDRALWWIEWALRHPKYTKNMNVNGKQFGYFRSNSFDVILCLILTLVVSIYLMWSVIKIMVKLLLKRLDKTLSKDKVGLTKKER